jgi:hypothetical protein
MQHEKTEGEKRVGGANQLMIILHLCADIGSDSYPYQQDPNYEVILVGKDIGVENYHPPVGVYGIIANPVCTEFSTARRGGKSGDWEKGIQMVTECLRIIEEAKPEWWCLENPAKGVLRRYLGPPPHVYQPYQYGSPWTKLTALWGNFTMPAMLTEKWSDVEKNPNLYVSPCRSKPSLAFLHKSAIKFIHEFAPFVEKVKTDADLRSLCSQRFAMAFKAANDNK